MAVQSGDARCGTQSWNHSGGGLEADSNVTVSVENTSTNRTMYMNCSDPALSDVNVRTALWYLIDAEAIRAIANSGFGELSETSFSQFCAVYAAPPADLPVLWTWRPLWSCSIRRATTRATPCSCPC